MSKICIKKLVCLTLVFCFLFSPLFSSRANAQWVVWDPGNFVPNAATAVSTSISASANVANGVVKEYGLDAVFFAIANLIIQRISASTVNWINSGFKGSPAYVVDPGAYFKDIGNKVAGQFIYSNPNLNFLCSPISMRIKLALAQNYSEQNINWQCSLTDVYGNMDDFINDFERGGWTKFFKLTQERQNNPIGAYLQAEGELAKRVAAAVGVKDKELSWGQGFMSFKKCPAGREVTAIVDGEDGTQVTYSDGVTLNQASDPTLEVGGCGVEEQTVTPGSVVSEQLNKTLGLGNDRLSVADEVNEIISALFNQLANRIIGGIGAGLRGLSSPDSSNNNSRFVDQLANSTSTTDYFGNTPDFSAINTPVPQPVSPDYFDSTQPTNPIGPGTTNTTQCDPNNPFCNP